MTPAPRSPPYTVLIVGCGRIAGGFDMHRPPEAPPLTHAGAFARHGGFRIDACVDPDDEARARFAAHWHIPESASSIAALGAAAGRFDVVCICSPTDCHREHLQAALELAPRVIFCEKPLTASEADSEQFVMACRQQGIVLAVNYTRRWDPSVARLVRDVKAGRWGRVRSAVGHYNKGILHNGGHLVELVLRLFGPLDLVAVAGCVYDHWRDDPTVAVLLTAREGGQPVYLNAGDARDYAFFELELVCERGVVRMEGGGMQWRTREAGPSGDFTGYNVLGQADCAAGRYPEAMGHAIAELHDLLAHGGEASCTGADALEVQRMCGRILHAAGSHPKRPGTAPTSRQT